DFEPDACLINLYEPETRLSLHRDENERDLTAPIVSVSLGLPATFLFGGNRRSDRPRRIPLQSGDVVVWGGVDRLVYHGVAPIARRSRAPLRPRPRRRAEPPLFSLLFAAEKQPASSLLARKLLRSEDRDGGGTATPLLLSVP